jgi:hypothetical protein
MSKTLLLHSTKPSEATSEIAVLGGRSTEHLSPDEIQNIARQTAEGTRLLAIPEPAAILGDTQVPSTSMSSSPSTVIFNNELYCFHQGSGKNGQLWYNVFNGTNWTGDVQVPGTGMSSSPSAIVFNNKLYCFHQSYPEQPRALGCRK